MSNSPKDIGSYYTNPELVSEILPWVLRGKRNLRILEPSCGDGRFLSQLSRYKNQISHVDACELMPAEAKKSSQALKVPGKIHYGDFFEWVFRTYVEETPFGFHVQEEVYDAVVGNPPYVSFRKQSPEQKDRVQRLMDAYGVPFNKHSSIWLPFLIASVLSLKQDGRLGMVIPSELLTVKYAQSIRDLLIDECSEIRVLDLPGVWFEGTQQACVVLLAIRNSQVPCRIGLHSNLRHTEMEFFHGPRMRGDKWTSLLIGESVRELLCEVSTRDSVYMLRDLSRVCTSFTTGCDDFFFLSEDEVVQHRLRQYVSPLVPKSSQFRGLEFTQSSHEDLAERGEKCWVLTLTQSYADLPPQVQNYIDYGLSIKADASYKSNARRVWYQLGDLPNSELCLYRRSDFAPRILLNRCGAVIARTAYHVTPNPGVRPCDLLMAFSTPLTWLSAELEGRSFGGGLLELSSNEMKRLLVLYPVGPSFQDFVADPKATSHEILSRVLTTNEQSLVQGAYQTLLSRRRNSKLST